MDDAKSAAVGGGDGGGGIPGSKRRRLDAEINRVKGELKAAKAEVIKLQHGLQAFAKDHNKNFNAIKFLLENRLASTRTSQQTTATTAATTTTAISPLQQTAGVTLANPIGHIESVFVRLNGTPRQGTFSPAAKSRLKITCFPNTGSSLEGLASFSHIWVIFVFHKNKNAAAKPKVAPPKLGGGRVGLFSTRAPYRPNPIGLSLARLDSIAGDVLHMSGLDLVDGTPVLDVKPYIPLYDSIPDATIPKWIRTPQDPSTFWEVTWTDECLAQLQSLSSKFKMLSSFGEAKQCISEVLETDPRSTYRKSKCADELYPLILDVLHIICKFDHKLDGKKEVHIIKVELLADTEYAEAKIGVTNLPTVQSTSKP